jgi:hypothetical protein
MLQFSGSQLGTRLQKALLAVLLMLPLLFVATPSSAKEGWLYTNNKTGEQVWLEDWGWSQGKVAKPEYVSKVKEHIGCPGMDWGKLVDSFSTGESNACFKITKKVSDSNPALAGVTKFFDTKTGKFLDEPEGRDSTAVFLFDVASGEIKGASCLSCDFIGFFMMALADFSESVFEYFLTAFRMMTPILVATWLGFRVAKLAAMGGEDGKAFLYQVVGRLALFAMIWLMVTAQANTTSADQSKRWFWNTTGPAYLNYAFQLSGDIRDTVIKKNDLGIGNNEVPLNCGKIVPATSKSVNYNPDLLFIRPGMQIACITERTHMLGMASGVAVMMSSVNGVNVADDGFTSVLIAGIVKIGTGALMIAVYGLSAVWLIFLVLDVVVRGLLTAAFSPVLATLFLFQPTRGIAVGAIKAMAGAMVTAIALSVVSVLAYFLMTNTIEVYGALHETVAVRFNNDNIKALSDGGRLAQFREFIGRVQVSDPGVPFIPMDFTSPWLYYMILSGLATFALGKKIIAMLEEMIGVRGMAEMANNAMKLTQTGVMAGFGTAVLAGGIAGKTGGAFIAPGAAVLKGGGGLIKDGAQAAKGAYQAHGAAKNIFGATKLGAEYTKNTMDAALPPEG